MLSSNQKRILSAVVASAFSPSTASEVLSQHTSQTGVVRCLWRFEGDISGLAPFDSATDIRVVLVDTETTGTKAPSLDADRQWQGDAVVEIGLQEVWIQPVSGLITRVGRSYSGFNDPGIPISPEASRVSGITQEMVEGKSVDRAAIAELLRGVALVIAHNAAFDRPFCERLHDAFTFAPWACSFSNVQWAQHGVSARALERLAYQCGFFYEAHRSLIDARVIAEVSQQMDGVVLRDLLASATPEHQTVRIWALNSGFEVKDALKQRGYRWRGEEPGTLPVKCWYRSVAVADLEAEQAWLAEAVYQRRPSAPIKLQSEPATTRFSAYEGRALDTALNRNWLGLLGLPAATKGE